MNEVPGHVVAWWKAGGKWDGGTAWTEREGNEAWYSLGILCRHYRTDAVLPWSAARIMIGDRKGSWENLPQWHWEVSHASLRTLVNLSRLG